MKRRRENGRSYQERACRAWDAAIKKQNTGKDLLFTVVVSPDRGFAGFSMSSDIDFEAGLDLIEDFVHAMRAKRATRAK